MITVFPSVLQYSMSYNSTMLQLARILLLEPDLSSCYSGFYTKCNDHQKTGNCSLKEDKDNNFVIC